MSANTLAHPRGLEVKQFAVGYDWIGTDGKKRTGRTVVPAVDGQAALHWFRHHYWNFERVWLIPAPKGATR